MDKHVIKLCGREIDRPGHICAFFESPKQEYETLAPYFRDGLNEGELVVNIVDDSVVGDHRARLAGDGFPLGNDGVSVFGSTETYLENGRFDMERMEAFVHDTLANARVKGKRVRTSGNMTWLRENAPGTDRAIEYEARMNLLVPKFDCTFMCVYDLSQLNGETVVDIMATHPYVILNGEIRENKFYIPPERYLDQLLARGSNGAS